MCPAAGAADLFDEGSTAGALGAVLTKNLEIVGEIAVFATSVFEVLEGSAADGDRFFHHVSGSAAESDRSLLGHLISSPGRSYLRTPQCFVDINIPEACDE